MRIEPNVLIYSPFEGYLGYLQFLAIMNKVTISIHVQMLRWANVSTHLSKYLGA